MKHRTTALAATAVLLLALTGCSGATDDAAPASSETPSPLMTPTSETTPEPLTAETPLPLSSDEADAAFLAYVDDELPPTTSIGNASQEQLIAAGHEACAQVADGVPWEDIRVVEGEQPSSTGYYLDTSAILNGALYHYCPELIPDVG